MKLSILLKPGSDFNAMVIAIAVLICLTGTAYAQSLNLSPREQKRLDVLLHKGYTPPHVYPTAASVKTYSVFMDVAAKGRRTEILKLAVSGDEDARRLFTAERPFKRANWKPYLQGRPRALLIVPYTVMLCRNCVVDTTMQSFIARTRNNFDRLLQVQVPQRYSEFNVVMIPNRAYYDMPGIPK